MNARITLWRIGPDTFDFEAHDLSGRGAQLSGGRWNDIGTPMVYCSSSRALAGFEASVRSATNPMPIKLHLIEVEVPMSAWENAVELDVTQLNNWNVRPADSSSIRWGTAWVGSKASLLARVPSTLVPEEFNVLINPLHAQSVEVRATKVRRWMHD